MFPLENAYNGYALSEIYEKVSELFDQNNWLYNDGVVIENNVDRRYRVTIETNGLNLVMRLPANTLHTHAMVVVNIDMDEWQRWISQWLDSYQTVIVLDQDYPDGIKKYYRELMEVTEPDRERRYIKKNFIDPIIQARTDYLEKNSNSILDDIIHLIEEKEGNISLTECAEILGVSQTYIWKVLKMERDKSFLDYVEEYKLKQAKHMLLNTTMSVAEIAEKLNYTNAQNFIRFFSKNVGVTPGKFRKLY